MKGLESRIEALERVYGPKPGCATCRDWPLRQFVIVRNDDAVLTAPTVCPTCGRQATVMTRIWRIVDSPFVDGEVA